MLLWRRLAAVAWIRPLAREIPHAAGAALKKRKKKKKDTVKKKNTMIAMKSGVRDEELSF